MIAPEQSSSVKNQEDKPSQSPKLKALNLQSQLAIAIVKDIDPLYDPQQWWSTKIRHSGFKRDDPRQQIVQYAYQLWGLDLVTLMECENGTREIARRGDAGMSVGICQMHTGYHRLPADYYTSRKKQVEVCNEKRRGGTKFYWPSRIIKGQYCSNYVKSRFIFE